jgi:hypothetical protein
MKLIEFIGLLKVIIKQPFTGVSRYAAAVKI